MSKCTVTKIHFQSNFLNLGRHEKLVLLGYLAERSGGADFAHSASGSGVRSAERSGIDWSGVEKECTPKKPECTQLWGHRTAFYSGEFERSGARTEI